MKKLLTVVLVAFTMQLFAQTNPITAINITLPANPDANTANWGTGASMLTITANAKATAGRIDPAVTESKILVIIKKNGSKICGAYTSGNAPASGFNNLTKVWSGSNAISLLGQDCTLPPGDYELSVQFFGYSLAKSAPISDEKIKPFTIRGNEQQVYRVPQPITPATGTIYKDADVRKPIAFRWTPLIPKPTEPVTYRLSVWQLMQGQTGVQAMRVNQPIFTKDIDNNITQAVANGIITGPCKPPYLCDFVWNVQALNRDGKPIGGNNGTSELFAFNYQQEDIANTPVDNGNIRIDLVSPDIELKPGDNRPVFRWQSTGGQPGQSYGIKVVEIHDSQSPVEALGKNKPFFEKDSLNELSVAYPPKLPPIDTGKAYAWAVTVFDRGGKQIAQSLAGSFLLPAQPFPTPPQCINFTITPNPVPVCQGAPVVIHLTGSVAGYTFSIAGTGGTVYTGGGSTTSQTISFPSPATPGTYSYTVAGYKLVYNPLLHYYMYCTGTATFTVNVFQSLSAAINHTQICNGQDAQLNVPNLPPGYTVNWFWWDGSGTPQPLGTGNPINTNAIITQCTPGVTSVTRTFRATIAGWPATCPISNVSLTVWCPSAAGAISPVGNSAGYICSNNVYPFTFPLTLNGSIVGNVSWAYTGPGGGTFVPNAANPSQFKVTVPGTYVISATVSNGTCASIIRSITVVVEDPLTVSISGSNGNAAVCPNDGVMLTANAPAAPAGSTYLWEYSANCSGIWTASSVSTSTQNTNPIGNMGPYSPVPITSLCWRVKVTAPNSACAPAMASYTINILQAPCTPVISSNIALPKCPGSAAMLSAPANCGSGTGPLTWQWYLNGIAIPGATNPTYPAVLPGNYTLEVKNQCVTRTSLPFAVADCINLLTITGPCNTSAGAAVTLTVHATNPPCWGTTNIYKWYANGIVIAGATGTTVQVSPTAGTTTYTVTVTSATGCQASTSIAVKVCP
ncbi:MAG: hypothetical protein V4592_10095 [Bacteroidota bacterium]